MKRTPPSSESTYPEGKKTKAKRAYLTDRERQAMHTRQHGKCGCGCGRKLRSWRGADAIGEHVHEMVAFGNTKKPDSLWDPECADRKTNGVRGDKSNIAHVKRLAEGRTQYDRRKAAGGTHIPRRSIWEWLSFSGERRTSEKKRG